MILAIDVGNTTIDFGIFDRDELVLRFSLSSSERTTPRKCWSKLQDFVTTETIIDGAICCSVVPEMTKMIGSFASEYLKVVLKEYEIGKDIGIINKYSVPGQVGGDRLINALAVKQFYSLPAIVVDIGTAVTVDVVNAESEYMGGAIAPGLGISVDALYKKTDLLPKVELVVPARILGTDTMSSMQSGLTYGFAGLIRSLVDGLKTELAMEEVAVIVTGGYTRVLEPLMDDIATAIDKNLTLKGLNAAYNLI